MSYYTDEFGGGDGGAVLDYQLFTYSQLYTVPYDGSLDLLVLAACGSGALGMHYVTGPGAGEIGISRSLPVYKGDVLTITVGLGGNPVEYDYAIQSGAGGVAGNAGSDTAISSSRGWSITVKGGDGGKVGPKGAHLVGALGGRGGSGAQIHIPGGDGGSVLTTAMQNLATGGGAPNFRNVQASLVRGGDITAAALSNTACSGGAGAGGNGGDITASAASATCGGGYGSPATANVLNSGGANALGKREAASPVLLIPSLAAWGVDIFGGGAQGQSANAGPGGGSAGTVAGVGGGLSDPSANLHSFGGAGAGTASAVSSNLVGKDAPIGSTSSSMCTYVGPGYRVTGGRGGQGCAVVILRKG